MSMPCRIENDIHRRTFIQDYEPAIEGRMSARIALGRALEADELAQLPQRVHVGRGPTQTATFIYAMSRGPFILPPVAYEILMDLEPSGHVFHELEAIARGVSLGRYFLQLQTPVVDCIDLDGTVFGNGRGRDYFDEVMARPHGPGGGPPYVMIHTAQRISLFPETIANRHWWRAPWQFANEHFCSSELPQRLKAAKVAGLQYTPCHLSGAD